MISRRQLRIKALSVLYAYNRKEWNDLESAEQELMLSIKKSYDLYHLILLLLIELSDIAHEKVLLSRQKRMPSPEDLDPNTRFADNRVINQIRNNEQLRKYSAANPLLWTKKNKITNFSSLSKFLNSSGLSWSSYPEAPRLIFNELVEWESYKEYMSSRDNSFKTDMKFVKDIVTQFLPVCEELEIALEELSIYWNDDLPYVSTMIKNSLGRFRDNDTGASISLPSLFTNEDDEKYAKVLLRKTILRNEENSAMIDRNTTNWEVERIALMDKLVMQLAVTEIVEFPEVPVKVTLNEYIDISKDYCTAKSSTFVNGILDKIVREMRVNGTFAKTGRGLVGEPGLNE
jgi:transcription antitermination protein NusB